MPFRTKAPVMSGTTLCPYCNSRFSVTETQLEAHDGMVRCGYCRKTFDARLRFVSDRPSPQLELPMLDTLVEPPSSLPVLQPMTLAEQVSIVDDESEFETERFTWHWTLGSFILLFVLLGQAAYFYRVDISARMPLFKPVLAYSCWLLDCKIPLPQYADLISIESSGLEADPGHKGWIILKALLRNRAPYAQALPSLELTLSDSSDMPQARRIFNPVDYLPKTENPVAGIQPDHELAIKLLLDTANLKPMGYRLALIYPD